MGVFYAIGGGNFEKRTNLFIDRKIIQETKKLHPKLLYIPTASNDRMDSIYTVTQYFRDLGCEVDVLYMNQMHDALSKFKENDILYFGGGMTKRLVDVAQTFHFNELIIDAYNEGKVIAGISAGAIMFFEYGYGDQFAFPYRSEMKGYRYVKGLGILDGIFVPHYQHSGLISFHDEVDKYPLNSYALEDMTALRITNNTYEVIKLNGMAVKFDCKQNYMLIPLKKDTIYQEKLLLGGSSYANGRFD